MTEYGYRKSRKKPILSKKNKNKSRFWAIKMAEMPLDYWKKVIFSDECRFSQFNDAYRTFVYRKKNQAYHAKTISHACFNNHYSLKIGMMMISVDYAPIVICVATNHLDEFKIKEDFSTSMMFQYKIFEQNIIFFPILNNRHLNSYVIFHVTFERLSTFCAPKMLNQNVKKLYEYWIFNITFYIQEVQPKRYSHLISKKPAKLWIKIVNNKFDTKVCSNVVGYESG
ncbi:hypothetical protein DERF_008550 [Dermatophagoides farinae]|uniref:Uncharacterized protein n=1 Tax=Dermatophagoides farinae TaxID=6954 RepID=A0A922L730_DERFA|nr:hypothetical protein DERF_008550 [Dermatophagoides farinae]